MHLWWDIWYVEFSYISIMKMETGISCTIDIGIIERRVTLGNNLCTLYCTKTFFPYTFDGALLLAVSSRLLCARKVFDMLEEATTNLS